MREIWKWESEITQKENIEKLFDAFDIDFLAKEFIDNNLHEHLFKNSKDIDMFTRDIIIHEIFEKIVFFKHKELSDSLEIKLWKYAFKAGLLDRSFVKRTLEMQFVQKTIKLDPYRLMRFLKPTYYETDYIFDMYDVSIMSYANNMSKPYFETLNDLIDVGAAKRIYSEFKVGGSMVISEEAQNFLIDNNEIIREIIINADEIGMFPTKEIRDSFLF